MIARQQAWLLVLLLTHITDRACCHCWPSLVGSASRKSDSTSTSMAARIADYRGSREGDSSPCCPDLPLNPAAGKSLRTSSHPERTNQITEERRIFLMTASEEPILRHACFTFSQVTSENSEIRKAIVLAIASFFRLWALMGHTQLELSTFKISTI